MGNLDLYEKVRKVPKNAQKPINAGRLKGMTDINPMFRIKTLTEQFGVCGFGWYYECIKQWIETVDNERVACVNINLYVKMGGEWSKPIFATGGSKLSTMEKSGLYVSDECYKMATTDAISVACKSLGIGADVYWSSDITKYSGNTKEQTEREEQEKDAQEKDAQETAKVEKMKIAPVKVQVLRKKCSDEGVPESKILSLYKVSDFSELTERQFRNINDNFHKIKEMQV
jgi:hypothetical protein